MDEELRAGGDDFSVFGTLDEVILPAFCHGELLTFLHLGAGAKRSRWGRMFRRCACMAMLVWHPPLGIFLTFSGQCDFPRPSRERLGHDMAKNANTTRD